MSFMKVVRNNIIFLNMQRSCRFVPLGPFLTEQTNTVLCELTELQWTVSVSAETDAFLTKRKNLLVWRWRVLLGSNAQCRFIMDSLLFINI